MGIPVYRPIAGYLAPFPRYSGVLVEIPDFKNRTRHGTEYSILFTVNLEPLKVKFGHKTE